MNQLRNWTWLIVLLAIITLGAAAGCGGNTSQSSQQYVQNQQGLLTISVLDVGQGDAILIRTAEQVVLIDTGDIPARDNLTARLKSMGITVIDKVIITHPHADHLGGMPAVLANFTVKHVYDSGQTTTTSLYRQYLGAVQQKNIPFTVLAAGDQLDFGSGVTFKVFAPQKPFITESELNNNSIVGKVMYGKFSMLMAADAEQEAEDRMLKSYAAQLQSTVLKSGHHGSRTASSLPFIKAVAPEAAVISLGANNDYHHPHAVTLKKYADLKMKVYRTDTDGTLTITSNGQSYNIVKERQ